MKVTSLLVRRAAQGMLAALLVVSTLLVPLAPVAGVASAQSSATPVDTPAVVSVSGTPLLATPGGDEIGTLPLGAFLTAIGRTADTRWLQVITETDEEGWVAAADVVAFGQGKLPVTGGAEGAAPAATPTKAPTKAPTATPVPSPTATPQPSPTAVPPTPTPVPTVAPTVAPTAAPTRASSAAASTSDSSTAQMAVVTRAGAELYEAPEGKAVKSFGLADALTVTGRSADGAWLAATTAEGESGWVQAGVVVVSDVEALPVLDGGDSDGAAKATEAATAVSDDVAVAAAEDEAAATTEAASAATPEAGKAGDEAVASETESAAAAPVTAQVAVEDTRLNIRSGPGADYRIVGKARSGETLAATGRTAAGDWVRVARADLPSGAGWVAAEFVTLDPADATLPEVAVEAAPEPAAVPTQAPAEEANQAPAEASTEAAAAPLPFPLPAPAQPQSSVKAQPAGLEGTIVFQDGRNNIYVYEPASGAIRWLTNGFDLDITRDGSKVTFVRGGGSDNGIWTVNIDGSNARKVYGGGEIMRSPKWSPDGAWIVFSRNFGSYKCFDLQFLGCVSFYQLQLQYPQIPPHVIYRIFLQDADRLEFPNWGIARINPDGGDFRDINALDSAVAPDWNEAGIVYQAKPGLEVTQDTPDGRTKAIFQEDWDWDPDWAPNGGRIAYQSKEGSHWEIWSINPDGSGVVALTRPETTLVDQLPSNVAPAYSPDGQHIVYVSNRDENEDAGPWRLWVMNADGGNKRPLPIEMEIDYTFAIEQVASWGE